MTSLKQMWEHGIQTCVSDTSSVYRRADALSSISVATSRLFKPSLLSNETLLLMLFYLNDHHHDNSRLASLVNQVGYLPRWSSNDFDDFKNAVSATIEDILIESGWQAFTFDESNNHYVLKGSLSSSILAPLYGFMSTDLSSIKARYQVTLSALKGLDSMRPSSKSTLH